MSSITTKRLGLMIRQYWIYNKKLIILCISGYAIGLFVFLYGIHMITEFATWHWGHAMGLFLFLLTILAIAYAGFSFPGFRSKEKAHNYLMLPATINEKYLFEFLNRIVLFLILMPLIFWTVYNLEGYWANLLHPEMEFQFLSPFHGYESHHPMRFVWFKIFHYAEWLLLLSAPFLGAAVYRRYPIVKTFLWASAIGIIHMILIFVFRTSFDLSGDTILIIGSIYIILINVLLLTWAYFKLKGKQA